MDCFIKLRRQWFVHHIRLHGPEREWESEEAEAHRESLNKEMWERYNKQTEEILNGLDRPIAPRCYNDLLSG